MYGLILWVVGFVYATIHCNVVLLWDVCIIGCVCVTWCLSRTSLYLTALSGLRFQCGVTALADLLSLVTPHFPHSRTAPTCLTALQHTHTKHTHPRGCCKITLLWAEFFSGITHTLHFHLDWHGTYEWWNNHNASRRTNPAWIELKYQLLLVL